MKRYQFILAVTSIAAISYASGYSNSKTLIDKQIVQIPVCSELQIHDSFMVRHKHEFDEALNSSQLMLKKGN